MKKYHVTVTHVGLLSFFDANSSGDFQGGKDLTLLTDTQEVSALKDFIAGRTHHKHKLQDFDSFLVSVHEGEYEKVFGIDSLYGIGNLNNPVYLVEFGIK